MKGTNLLLVVIIAIAIYFAWTNKAKVGGGGIESQPPSIAPGTSPGSAGGADPTIVAVTGTIANLIESGLNKVFGNSTPSVQIAPSSTGGFDSGSGIPWRPA